MTYYLLPVSDPLVISLLNAFWYRIVVSFSYHNIVICFKISKSHYKDRYTIGQIVCQRVIITVKIELQISSYFSNIRTYIKWTTVLLHYYYYYYYSIRSDVHFRKYFQKLENFGKILISKINGYCLNILCFTNIFILKSVYYYPF